MSHTLLSLLGPLCCRMTGQLRLKKLAKAFSSESLATEKSNSPRDSSTNSVHGPLYFRAEHETAVDRAPKAIQKMEMESDVPLSEVLMVSQSHGNLSGPWLPNEQFKCTELRLHTQNRIAWLLPLQCSLTS